MSLLASDICLRCGHTRDLHGSSTFVPGEPCHWHYDDPNGETHYGCVCGDFLWHPAPEDACARCGHWRNEHNQPVGTTPDTIATCSHDSCTCIQFAERPEAPEPWEATKCANCGHTRWAHVIGSNPNRGMPLVGACNWAKQDKTPGSTNFLAWSYCACPKFREQEPTEAHAHAGSLPRNALRRVRCVTGLGPWDGWFHGWLSAQDGAADIFALVEAKDGTVHRVHYRGMVFLPDKE